MAKTKDIENSEEVNAPGNQIMDLLKKSKGDHYNFENDNYYKVPSSSLLLNMGLSGGLSPGAHRFTGATSGGKTSAALDFMRNFLKESTNGENRRGIFFRCEGRLSPDIQTRAGIEFTTNPDEWKNGNTLIVDSNVYEFVFDIMRNLIVDNSTNTKYFMIIDSVDMMAKRSDIEKPIEDAQTVAAGALITSVFLKKVSTAMVKRGHIVIFISQIRETVKINPYDKTPPKQGNASGGHAIEHAADVVIEFLNRYSDDIIRENPNDKNSKPIGHFARAKIVKSNNEKYLQEVRYPICYGRTNGQSVWRERELLDLLLVWDQLKKSGAWYKVDESLIEELKEQNIEMNETFHGIDNVQKWLFDNPVAVEYLINKFKNLV